uniref:Uncharacterized protein n=1 Tax=Zea mays TaxID=4577 RepID=C4J6H5_MAIZE|nr:unknown [Zea mays]
MLRACASRLASTRSAMALRVSCVPLPMCGARTTLSSAMSACGTSGSAWNTSSPAPPRRPSASAATSSGSSTCAPRPTLTSTHRGAERLDHLAAHDAAALLVQRAGHHEDIAVCCELEHRREIDVVGVRILPCSLVVADRATEAFHSLGNGKPYPAQPNDADPFATEPSGETVVAIIGLPQPGADVAVGVRDPAESGDGESHGKVRDVVGEHVGGVGDPDPALAASGKVHAVVADGVARDDLEPREVVDESRVAAEARAAANDHGADR